jgi:hypothetical protein
MTNSVTRNMTGATHSPLFVTKELFETRYQGAEAIFVAGSVVRGEASTYSDLDLVVIYPKVEAAYRDSFTFKGWPVEAFVHDSKTLRYFFENVDKQIGRATLADMVSEGHEIPCATVTTNDLKSLAKATLREGPPALTKDDVDDRRYHISELIDDIREPRNRQELIASGTLIYQELADYYFRSNRSWAGTGKAVLRRMKKQDPAFARRFADAFDMLFAEGQSTKVVELAKELLAPVGGFLFEGYRRDVSPDWRMP